jgi:cytochrome b561
MALLIIVSLEMIELRDWHSQVGLVVFALVWLRLFWKFVNIEPAIVPPPAAWQRRAASLWHKFFRRDNTLAQMW